MSFTSPKTLPQAHGVEIAMGATLSEEDQDLLRMVRDFLEAEVSPIITECWIREEFPHQLLPKLAELHIMGLAYQTLLTRIDMETTLIGLVLHVDLHQERSSFPKLPSRITRLFEYSNLWQTPKKGLTREEMNSPGYEDARITVPWLPLSLMLSGFFSPLPREVAQHSFTSPVSKTFGVESNKKGTH